MNNLVSTEKELSLRSKCVEFLFAYQQKNVERMLNCCSPDGDIDFTPLGDQGKGKIHVLGKAMWTGLIEAFPDIDNTLDAAVAEDEKTVRCQVVIRGKQAKDFAGITCKDKSFDSGHIFVFKIGDDDMINSITVTWDHADLQKQLS